MRPATSSNSSSSSAMGGGAAGFRNFRSPIPYLFGGLALMLGLIAVALFILACSYRTHSSSSTSSSSAAAGDEEKPPKTVDLEPKILVIMAGDSNPTYLAKPVSSIAHSEQV